MVLFILLEYRVLQNLIIRKKILKLTNKITELLIGELNGAGNSGTLSNIRGGSWKYRFVGQVLITCQDVTNSMENLDYLEEHKTLYKDVIMEDRPPLTSPDGSSKRSLPERFPRPLYSRNSIQEDLTIPQHDQSIAVKKKIKKEEDAYDWKKDFSKTQNDLYMGVKMESPESCPPPPLYSRSSTLENHIIHHHDQGEEVKDPKVDIKEDTLMRREQAMEEEGHTIPHHDKDEEQIYITVKVKEEEEEILVRGDEQSMEEGVKSEQEEPSLHIDTNGSSNPPERCPHPLYFQDSTQEGYTIPRQKKGEEVYRQVEIKEEEETSVIGDRQSIECGKYFVKEDSLVIHQRNHTGERPFPCQECEKSFTQKQYLLKHQKIHTSERPYPCAECGKCFIGKRDLLKHQKIHTGVHPFCCPECGKSFIQKGDLNRHLRIHTGRKHMSARRSLCMLPMTRWLITEEVITSVQQYPELYDKSHTKNKDNRHCDRIWEQITKRLYGDDLDALDATKRAEKVVKVMKRWKNIRDAYRKHLNKTRLEQGSVSGAPAHKPYKYARRLRFLIRVRGFRETVDNLENSEDEDAQQEEEQDAPKPLTPQASPQALPQTEESHSQEPQEAEVDLYDVEDPQTITFSDVAGPSTTSLRQVSTLQRRKPRLARPKPNMQQEFLKLVHRMVNHLEKKDENKKDRSANEAFALSLVAYLDQIQPPYDLSAKSAVIDVLDRYVNSPQTAQNMRYQPFNYQTPLPQATRSPLSYPQYSTYPPSAGPSSMHYPHQHRSYETTPPPSYETPSAHSYEAPPHRSYEAPPQRPYEAPPQRPYEAPPQRPYEAPPQRPYEAPPQRSYEAPPQRSYEAQPMNQRNTMSTDSTQSNNSMDTSFTDLSQSSRPPSTSSIFSSSISSSISPDLL